MTDRIDGARHRLLPTILLAGVCAAVLEIAPSIAIQNARGVPPLRMFQAIASGFSGRAAYQGGLASGLLGAGTHLSISLVAAAVFVAAARRAPVLSRNWIISGPVFGLMAYAVMNYVVVPLSNAAFKPSTDPAMLAVSLSVHALLFGLPIAFVAHRGQR